MIKHIVILTASSGGGHNAAAEALKGLITAHREESFQFHVIDIYKKNVFRRLPLLARVRYHSDFLWRYFLALTNHQLISRAIAACMRPFMIRSISKQLPAQCDYLIAVHFNPAQCLPMLASQFQTYPKTAIVVTDFDPHWAWLGPGCDAVYISSENGRDKAQARGYKQHQIYPLTLIPTERVTFRQSTVSCSQRIRVGIVSGQDGSNAEQIGKVLAMMTVLPMAAQIDLDLYCGSNQKLKANLASRIEEFTPMQLNVLGYTADLKAKFHQYDLMLIRTSPGILSECISAGVPVVGFEWSAHEQYQKQFIEQHSLGFASKSVTKLQSYLATILSEPQRLADLQKNVSALRNQQNTQEMVAHLLEKKAA